MSDGRIDPNESSASERASIRSTEALLSGAGHVKWPFSFFPYQIEGIHAFLSHDALLLADDMGLGKTIQSIGAMRVLFAQKQIQHVLLIVPAGLISQWKKEVRLWAPELRISTVYGPASQRSWQWAVPAQITLTSYETFRSDCTANVQSPPRCRTWDIVVLDEAHKIKNRDTDLSKKCKLLRRHRAWALTGTPLENREDDLASVVEFVSPLEEGETGQRYTPGTRLRKRHGEIQLRRKKSDVLPQLPPKIHSEILLTMTGRQRQVYDLAEQEGIFQLKESGESVEIGHILALIMKLKQICNFSPTDGTSVKMEDLLDRLETLAQEGHRTLIFSQFTDARYGVRAIANGMSVYNPLIYTGDMTQEQRKAAVIAFQNCQQHKALVLSLRAGGMGLNLQDASYVFHFDRWWNPAVEHQAEDRAHRLGQARPVHVFSYIVENTIEQRIDEILKAKQQLFDDLVDNVSIKLDTRLTVSELFGLFGLKAPEHAKRGKENLPG